MKFNKTRFIIYVTEAFGLRQFSSELVGNLIDYALENKAHSLDEVCYFLSDMMPEVNFEEVAMFCDDSILTKHGREMKAIGIDAWGDTDAYTKAIQYAITEE